MSAIVVRINCENKLSRFPNGFTVESRNRLFRLVEETIDLTLESLAIALLQVDAG